MTPDIPTNLEMVLRSGESKFYQNYSHEYQDSRGMRNLIEVLIFPRRRGEQESAWNYKNRERERQSVCICLLPAMSKLFRKTQW